MTARRALGFPLAEPESAAVVAGTVVFDAPGVSAGLPSGDLAVATAAFDVK